MPVDGVLEGCREAVVVLGRHHDERIGFGQPPGHGRQLVRRLVRDPDKGGRDRGIGQCADYSREFVTWMVIIGSPAWRIQELEELLLGKGLDGIRVVSFT